MPRETNVLDCLAEQIEEVILETATDAMSLARTNEWHDELQSAVRSAIDRAARYAR